MKIYLMTVYYDNTTEKQIYTTEEQAKQSALRWAKNSGREVWVDELKPIEGQFMKIRTCGRYDKTSE